MSETNNSFSDAPLLPREFFENQRAFPRETLAPFRGQYVAWNWEGDRVVGHAATREELWQQLEAAGLNCRPALIEYVPDV